MQKNTDINKNIELFIESEYLNINYHLNKIMLDEGSDFIALTALSKSLAIIIKNIGYEPSINMHINSFNKKSAYLNLFFKLSKINNWRIKKDVLKVLNVSSKDFKKILYKKINLNNSIYNLIYSFFNLCNIKITELTRLNITNTDPHFEASLTLDLKDFPILHNEILSYIDYRDKNFLLESEEKRLYLLYLEERFNACLMTDIEYCVSVSDRDNLQKDLDALVRKINELNNKIEKRKKILLENDHENIYKPDSSFNFDIKRYKKLKNYYR